MVIFNDVLSFAGQNSKGRCKKDIQKEIEEIAIAMNSKPKIIGNNAYFILDNRDEIAERVKKENEENRSSGTIRYGYVIKTHEIDAPKGETCIVKSSAYVKTIYEQHVYRFLDCQSVTWSAFGSNSYSVNPSNGNYYIEGDGRYLNVSGDFNIETCVSHSTSASFGALGWSIGGSVGGEIIIRKWVVKTFEFDGNHLEVIYTTKAFLKRVIEVFINLIYRIV